MENLVKNIFCEQVVSFHPALARVTGSINSALFLQQILYWMPRTDDEDAWVYKTQKELEEETALSRAEQETARKKLRDMGLLEEKLEGLPARKWYRCDLDLLAKLMANHRNPAWEKSPLSVPESSI